jgi:hypothetical protein
MHRPRRARTRHGARQRDCGVSIGDCGVSITVSIAVPISPARPLRPLPRREAARRRVSRRPRGEKSEPARELLLRLPTFGLDIEALEIIGYPEYRGPGIYFVG